MNTIFHIDDMPKWPTLLSNVTHMAQWQASQAQTGTIEVLINGEAVAAAQAHSNVDLNVLTELGVVVNVCENSLAQRHIEKETLQPRVGTVPVGVVELAQRQAAGYAYIKP